MVKKDSFGSLDELVEAYNLLRDDLDINSGKYGLNKLYEKRRKLIELSDKILYYRRGRLVVDDEISLVYEPFDVDEKYVGDYSIYLNDGSHVGALTLYTIKGSGVWRCNLGYHVDFDYRNRGYCSKSVCVLLKYLKEKGFPFVQINVFQDNKPSLKVAEKVGEQFKLYKTKEHDLCRHLVVLDEASFSKYLKNIHSNPDYYFEHSVDNESENLGCSDSSFKVCNYSEGCNFFVEDTI